MPRRAPVDQTALSELLRPGASVATHAELRSVGVPSSTITHRIQRRGPWQRALPGVVAGHRGVLTLHERRLAALKHAGGGSALTALDDLDAVRELVAAVVQQRFCTVAEVVAEVRLAQRQRTALSREVLAEVAAGIRSVAEARLRAGFTRFGVPQPDWNHEVRGPDGQLLMTLDAYWEDLDAELETNSVEWHLSPGRHKRTTQRQRRVVLSGLRTISVLPSEIEDDLEGVCREVAQFLRVRAAEQQRRAS